MSSVKVAGMRIIAASHGAALRWIRGTGVLCVEPSRRRICAGHEASSTNERHSAMVSGLKNP